MLARCLAALLLALRALPALAAENTALDHYVAAPDPSYRYELLTTLGGDGYTAAVLRMTSQRWRSSVEVDRPLWTHFLTIIRPLQLRHRTGLLVLSGGASGKAPPAAANPFLAALAVRTGSVVSELRNVPNEPLTFAGETMPRTEDGIIAYSWDRYLRTGDASWPAQLPMTKSAVRAMDTIGAFCGSAAGGAVAIDSFVVEGASKRGWTAWLTAAVDKRVVAIIPVVADLLNLEPAFAHQHAVYGFWAPALHDYESMGIMRWIGTPQMDALAGIVDPYTYRDRLALPKFILNSAGDQFFLPDSSRFYLAGLRGPTDLRYVANTNHSLRDSDASVSAAAFYEAFLSHTPLPDYAWRFEPDGSIRFETRTKPSTVTLWQARNPTARDFRLETIGPAYTAAPLGDQGGGVYVGKVAPPAAGYVAYFVEATYPMASGLPLKVTSGVRIVPDVEPYAVPRAQPHAGMPQPG
jgi:PhoPQ-activated pathogenicity-related protein